MQKKMGVWTAVVVVGIARQALALSFDVAAAKEYPVSRVVTLLTDMKKQLEKEQDADEEVYSKMACWCTTNDKSKTKSIADAAAKIENLNNKIEGLTATSQTLNGEIAGLTKEVAENKKSLAVATALRAKQLAEFNAVEKEMMASISALNSAVIVLSKHNGGASAAAFLNNKVIMKAFATAKALSEKHVSLLQGVITPSQKRLVASLAQDQGPTFAAYKPQSGQVFGIIKQMKETFEADLSNSQKEEMASAAAYEDLKKAKEEEIAAGETSLATKTQALASTDEANAQAAEDKEDTQAAFDADTKFLSDLKTKCSLTDSEWEQRQKDRNIELEAVAKATAILSSDEARDQFSKSFNFLQVSKESQGRKQAAQVLSSVPKLALLAVSARLDPFPKVKAAIDKMVAALQKESEEEVKHKDFCIDGFQTNEKDTQKKTHTKINTESKIAGLQQTIKEKKAEIQVVTTEMEELTQAIKRAGEDRAAEKKDFEGVVADQRETQRLLKSALDVLKKVYGDGVVLLQQEPPAGFSDYKKSTQSTGVIAMISQIIADAKELEAEAVHDEATAVKLYTEFVKNSNASLKTKGESKVDLNAQKAKAEGSLTQSKSELDGTMKELGNLADGAGALHKSCDYTLKNFDVRQEARDQEVDALRKAKAFLSGMTF